LAVVRRWVVPIAAGAAVGLLALLPGVVARGAANLARVYHKLGIRSRAELGARLAGASRG
jgi:hypothetical protein